MSPRASHLGVIALPCRGQPRYWQEKTGRYAIVYTPLAFREEYRHRIFSISRRQWFEFPFQGPVGINSSVGVLH